MNRKFNKRRIRTRSHLRSCLAAALLLLSLGVHAQQPSSGTTSFAAQPPATHDFSLAQAIDYAAKNSVAVKNALLDYQIQEQSNRAITSQALPQISGTIGATYYMQFPATAVPGGSFPGTTPGKVYAFSFGLPSTNNLGVTLKQVLFDGQVFVGLQARQASLDFYRKRQEITEQLIRVNINKVYYQLLVAKFQLAQIDANIHSQEELLHNSTEMFKNGFAEQLDVDKATVQLSNLQSERIQTEYNISYGYLGLKVLLGMPIRDSIALTDTLTYDMVRDAVLTDDYKYGDRREFQLMEINKKLNEYDIKRYQKQYIPTVNLSATYQQTQYWYNINPFERGTWFPGSWVGLNINIPIFDGFNKDANIRQARLKLRETLNNEDSLKIRIDNDARDAQLRFNAALATLDFQKRNMDLSEKVYAQTRKKYEQGLGSNIEITNAFSDERTAQANYFNALYNAISAKVDYQYAIGKL
jgi:outer membrane protein